MLSEKAFAKINLILTLRGKRDGLHLIDSVFYLTDLADHLTLEITDEDYNEVVYTDGRSYEKDTALITANLIKEKFSTKSVKVTISKHIPEGGGLGGSSADAGAVARLMQRAFCLPTIQEELLLKVGSDVPFCYRNLHARVRGIGEEVEAITLPKLYVALVIPSSGVSTAQSYAKYDQIGGDDGDVDEFLTKLRSRKKVTCVNALERASTKLNSDIAVGKEIVASVGFDGYGMTGSGSTLFGFCYQEDEFYKKLALIKEKVNGDFKIFYQ